MRNRIVLGLFLLAIILAGCDPSTKDKMEFYSQTKTTDLSKENIRSISIHSSEKKVAEEFGKPDSIENIEMPKSSYYLYGKINVEFRVVNGKVTRYLLSSKKYSTSKGITVGSRKEDVIKAYGDHFYERNDTCAAIVGYFDKANKINIEFGLNHGQVAGIAVSELKSNDNSK